MFFIVNTRRQHVRSPEGVICNLCCYYKFEREKKKYEEEENKLEKNSFTCHVDLFSYNDSAGIFRIYSVYV